MPSLLSEYGLDASRAVSEVLGESCIYLKESTQQTYSNLLIKITKGKELKDELGAVYGVRIEASIIKSDLSFRPEQYDKITDSSGDAFIIDQIVSETSNKWYCSVSEYYG